MSDLIIKDGTGAGFRAGVNSDGRVLTEAKTLFQVSVETLAGNQYLLPVGKRVITTVDTQHALLYLNPNANTKAFFAQRFVITVRDETPCLFRLYRGAAAPTANNVQFAPGNTNTLSTKSASILAHQWNGVGTGMTVASLGTESFAGYFGRGLSDIPVDGGQIWGFNSHILATVECAAANAVTLVVTGWEEGVA